MLQNSMLFNWINALRNDPVDGIITMLMQIVAILGALILHEVAHGYVALWCGDPTAKMLGRLSLNPARHLDPIGTAMMLLLGVGFAKPVPVNPRNFRNYRRDDLLVSLAGVTMNMLLFLVSGFLYVLCYRWFHETNGFLSQVLYYLYQFFGMFSSLNLGLALFNLLPIPPLDGYHVLNDILLKGKLQLSPDMFRMFQLGLMALLVFTNVVDRLLFTLRSAVWTPVIQFFTTIVFGR